MAKPAENNIKFYTLKKPLIHIMEFPSSRHIPGNVSHFSEVDITLTPHNLQCFNHSSYVFDSQQVCYMLVDRTYNVSNNTSYILLKKQIDKIEEINPKI